ncbi:hypothetical protein ACWGS9_28730 [Bradyrhizobium sp. Arg314]
MLTIARRCIVRTVSASGKLSQTQIHADLKDRDAFVFDPIVSKYLLRPDDHLEVVTPYSRTVPFASWDADRHAWMVLAPALEPDRGGGQTQRTGRDG